jgi:FHS family L-fucose permease-like MFS transporter
LLCLGIVGGAIVPVIQGAFADTIGLQLSFALPLLCYLFIAYYGIAGAKVRL